MFLKYLKTMQRSMKSLRLCTAVSLANLLSVPLDFILQALKPKLEDFNAQDAIEIAWVLGFSLVPFYEKESRRFAEIYYYHNGLLMGNWRSHPTTGHTFWRKDRRLYDPDTGLQDDAALDRIEERLFLALRNG